MIDSYSPAVFDVGNLEDAKAIILTPEGGTTDDRWAKETPYLASLCVEHLDLGPDKVVVDYGCGIGRMARELIRQTGCFVIGVDISPSMRALANVYVNSPGFLACAPEALPLLGFKFDAAISVWVLQHCQTPQREIGLIKNGLNEGGKFLVVNNHGRAVPMRSGNWGTDGVDVRGLLTQQFKVVSELGTLPADIAPPGLPEHTFWQVYQKD